MAHSARMVSPAPCRWSSRLVTMMIFFALVVSRSASFVLLESRSVSSITHAIQPPAAFNPMILRLSKDNSSEGNEEETMSEAERMQVVRSLQKSFYATDSDDDTSLPRPALDPATGILKNLPLWRVGWVEVPGRATCLNVHEGQYTHMFETILNGPKPWYVGHLHLPGGFKMTRTGERRYKLKSWRDELQDKRRYQQPERSAVVGCLMRITDYRRMQDGRLCLLVHVMERFVVDEVVQEFPYSVADVQILLDQEELPDGLVDENFAKVARGAVVQRSFQYHPYEFYNVELPINRSLEYTPIGSVNEAAISKLLPFASYSLDDSLLDNIPAAEEYDVATSLEGEGFSGGSPPLEKHLQAWRILKNPPPISEDSQPKNADLDGLETLLWLAVEDLVRKTGFVLPSEILTLQPPHMDYLDLRPPNVDYLHLEEPSMALSEKYPPYRRQKRLSYALPALLENTNVGAGMRQVWLNAPSTKIRLEAVLERFEKVNASLESQME